MIGFQERLIKLDLIKKIKKMKNNFMKSSLKRSNSIFNKFPKCSLPKYLVLRTDKDTSSRIVGEYNDRLEAEQKTESLTAHSEKNKLGSKFSIIVAKRIPKVDEK